MSRRFGLVAVAGLVFLLPTAAHAQRGMGRMRNAPAMTPYGPVFNPTQTPEWRQAGGNIDVWQQIMMQKMAAQEQAAFQKQVAAYQKTLKANGQNPATAGATNGAGLGTLGPVRTTKKRRPTLKPSTTATAKGDAKKDAKAGSDKDDEEGADDAATPGVKPTDKPATGSTPATSTPAVPSSTTAKSATPG